MKKETLLVLMQKTFEEYQKVEGNTLTTEIIDEFLNEFEEKFTYGGKNVVSYLKLQNTVYQVLLNNISKINILCNQIIDKTLETSQSPLSVAFSPSNISKDEAVKKLITDLFELKSIRKTGNTPAMIEHILSMESFRNGVIYKNSDFNQFYSRFNHLVNDENLLFQDESFLKNGLKVFDETYLDFKNVNFQKEKDVVNGFFEMLTNMDTFQKYKEILKDKEILGKIHFSIFDNFQKDALQLVNYPKVAKQQYEENKKNDVFLEGSILAKVFFDEKQLCLLVKNGWYSDIYKGKKPLELCFEQNEVSKHPNRLFREAVMAKNYIIAGFGEENETAFKKLDDYWLLQDLSINEENYDAVLKYSKERNAFNDCYFEHWNNLRKRKEININDFIEVEEEESKSFLFNLSKLNTVMKMINFNQVHVNFENVQIVEEQEKLRVTISGRNSSKLKSIDILNFLLENKQYFEERGNDAYNPISNVLLEDRKQSFRMNIRKMLLSVDLDVKGKNSIVKI